MQYLGGKSRIARAIADVVAPQGPWWEPFCGGLSVSVQLARYGSGLVSDAHPALIALYQAVRAGWVPPESVSREEYEAARELPDSDPLKAFIGFGCSYGGKWWGGYVGPRRRWNNRTYNPGWIADDPIAATARALQRDLAILDECAIACLDFLAVRPERGRFEVIYCDPPYAGVTGYKGVGPFDHARFWQRCAEWAALGTRVYVSEYEAGAARAQCVWQRETRDRMWGAGGEQRAKTERLFYLGPRRKRVQLAFDWGCAS